MSAIVARVALALRIRVSMSEIGSVIIGLPACFSNTRNFTNVGELAEADTAEAERSHEEALTTTAPASVHNARAELRRFCRLRNLIRCCHSLFLLLHEWEPKGREKGNPFFMILGCSSDGDL